MNNKNEINIRTAQLEDVEEIYNFIAKIYENIEEKSWYSYSKNIERYKLFINDGYSVVACHKGKIIGVCLTYILRDDGTEFYQIVKELYKGTNDIIEVINYAVSENYRGMGLQNKMLLKIEDMLKDTKYKDFIATVHPDNKYSLNNMLKNGYKIAMKTKLYGGLDRCIIVKNIKED